MIEAINAQGVTLLIVEQNVWLTLEVAHYGYILENGAIVGHGPTETLRHDRQIQEAYLGI